MQLADSEVKLSLIHPPCCGEILGGSSQNIFWGQLCEKGYKKAKFRKKMKSVGKGKKYKTKYNKIQPEKQDATILPIQVRGTVSP